MDYQAPKWIMLANDTYKKILNRKAVSLTKRDKRRGGSYQVKEAMNAIHLAFQNCQGSDPYDGMPLESQLLEIEDRAIQRITEIACKRQFRRMPTVAHITAEPVAQFEIVSRQTYDAKEGYGSEEFIDYCRAVVANSKKSKR